jgi:hypothetical protein
MKDLEVAGARPKIDRTPLINYNGKSLFGLTAGDEENARNGPFKGVFEHPLI